MPNVLVAIGSVCFSIISLTLLYSKNIQTYQKMTAFFISLLNGVVLFLATVSIPFEGVSLLIVGVILTELIVFKQLNLEKSALISVAILFLVLTFGLWSDLGSRVLFFKKYSSNTELLEAIRICSSLFLLMVIAAVLMRFKKNINVVNLFKSERAIEFLSISIILMASVITSLFQISGYESYVFLMSLSMFAAYLLLFGYVFYSSGLEATKLQEVVLERQLKAQIVSHNLYLKYADDTGVFRHDFKAICRSANELGLNETLDGKEVIADLERRFNGIVIQKKLSNNSIVDAVLKTARIDFVEHNIDFEAMVYLPEHLQYNLISLSRILFSVMDNAFFAAVQLPEEKRFFTIESIRKPDWATIVIVYSSNGRDIEKKPTTPEEHLILMNYMIIQELIEADDGDKIFHLTVDEETGDVSINIHIHIDELS